MPLDKDTINQSVLIIYLIEYFVMSSVESSIKKENSLKPN